jgi:hypothetical protein
MTKHRLIASVVAVVGLAALPAAAGASGSDRLIKVEDRCDPATFDAALGDGACVPVSSSGGQVTFDELFAELADKREHGGWSFSREKVQLDEGGSLTVRLTRGGEFHTFTQVERFGPGCVPELNAPVFPGQDQTPPAICDDPEVFGLTGVFPGHDLEVENLSAGTYRFMCLIHPWMKTTAEVR